MPARVQQTVVTTFLALAAMHGQQILNATRLQNAITQAYSAGLHEYVIPEGTYRLPKAAADYFLNFTGMKDFTIRAEGVTFILQDPTKGGFHFTGCRNVSLRGLTMRHDPVPFSQATITAIDIPNATVDVAVMAGYPDWTRNPDLMSPTTVGDVFDRNTRQWKAGTIDFFLNGVTPLGGDRFRLSIGNPLAQPAKVGDLMMFRGNVEADVQLDQCEKMNVKGVTIESSTGFCVHEQDGNGDNHYTFKLTYGPPPEGAVERPLVSSNADAFHSNATRIGPTVENCTFEGMPDDGANIHGNYAAVVQVQGTTLIVNTLWGDLPVKPGDPLLFFSSTDVPLDKRAIVKSATPLPNFVAPHPSQLAYFNSVQNYWKIELEHPISVAQDELVDMPEAVGKRFVFRHNLVKNNRARGIIAKAPEGVIEGNTFDGNTIAGIVVSPELAGGMESDFSHDLVIRDNVIRHVGYQNVGPWVNQAGAVTVTSDPGGGIGHHRIIIENNSFELLDGINLLLTNARELIVRNNRFYRPMHHSTDRGADQGFDLNALIYLQQDRNVWLHDNRIIDPGPQMKKRLTVGPDVKGVHNGKLP